MKIINKKLLKLAAVLFLFAISACGGGSSGDGGSDFSAGSNIFQTEGRSAATGVRLLHGAIDAGPIDLLLSSKAEVATTARFALNYPFVSASGTVIATVVPHNATNPTLFAKELLLDKNSRGTILLYGNNDYLGLSTVYLADGRNPDIGGDQTAVRVIHATVGAAQVQLSGTIAATRTADFGRASEYISAAAGQHTLKITRVVDGRVLYSGTVNLAGGTHYSLFISGDTDYYVRTRLIED